MSSGPIISKGLFLLYNEIGLTFSLYLCKSLFCFAEVAPGEWTDDLIKACLYLYLALLPTNHKLFHEYV